MNETGIILVAVAVAILIITIIVVKANQARKEQKSVKTGGGFKRKEDGGRNRDVERKDMP